jgi:hypothetical protein
MEADHNDNDIAVDRKAELPDHRVPPRARPGLGVNGTQVCASTLASVSAAVVASVFGVAGTIAGAPVVSVVATTGSALYSHGIRHTGAKLQQAQLSRFVRPAGSWPGPAAGRASTDPVLGGEERAVGTTPRHLASEPGHVTPDRTAWMTRRRWGVVAGVVLVFVASLVAVSLIEFAGQRPLASVTGHHPSGTTSIGSLFEGDGPVSPDATTVPPGTPSTTSESDASAETPDPADTTSTEPTAPTATDPPPAGDPTPEAAPP